jgi:hypothetical protein
MRALVALVVVALVGLAVDAQVAAAGASKSKNPGASVSVDLGSASVTTDVSTDGADASVAGSTPSTSVDATVESSSTAPVSATGSASTPVAEASAEVATPTGEPPRVKAKASSPLGSATAQADTSKGTATSVQVATPIRRAKTAVAVSSAATSVEGSAGVVSRPERAQAGAAVSLGNVAQPTRTKGRTGASFQARAPLAPAAGKKAPLNTVLAPRTVPAPLSGVLGSPPPTTERLAEAAPAATVIPEKRGSAPAPPSGGPGGAIGSGISTAFFAILSALLMLAAPIVGRWLRPATGMALQPAFASLPERPG